MGSGKEEERGKWRQEGAGDWVGWRPERADKEDREREVGQRKLRGQKGSGNMGPSLPGCLSARLRSASSKPLLKLLHVGA